MYYPKNKIITNLYTSGNELFNKTTLQPYIGHYFSTFDGKFFSKKEPSSDSIELIKFSKDVNRNQQTFDHFSPVPGNDDYEKGFITRYAIKRINSGVDTIKEISKNDFQKVKNNILYSSVQFDWKITGELYDNPDKLIYGIIDTNRRTIQKNEKIIPGLGIVFRNLSQFARNIL